MLSISTLPRKVLLALALLALTAPAHAAAPKIELPQLNLKTLQLALAKLEAAKRAESPAVDEEEDLEDQGGAEGEAPEDETAEATTKSNAS